MRSDFTNFKVVDFQGVRPRLLLMPVIQLLVLPVGKGYHKTA